MSDFFLKINPGIFVEKYSDSVMAVLSTNLLPRSVLRSTFPSTLPTLIYITWPKGKFFKILGKASSFHSQEILMIPDFSPTLVGLMLLYMNGNKSCSQVLIFGRQWL